MTKCAICRVAAFISAIAAINWALAALFNFNFITILLGDGTLGARIIYGLIGGLGTVLLISTFGGCKLCKK